MFSSSNMIIKDYWLQACGQSFKNWARKGMEDNIFEYIWKDLTQVDHFIMHPLTKLNHMVIPSFREPEKNISTKSQRFCYSNWTKSEWLAYFCHAMVILSLFLTQPMASCNPWAKHFFLDPTPLPQKKVVRMKSLVCVQKGCCVQTWIFQTALISLWSHCPQDRCLFLSGPKFFWPLTLNIFKTVTPYFIYMQN